MNTDKSSAYNYDTRSKSRPVETAVSRERTRERYALGRFGQDAMDALRYRREAGLEYDPYSEATVLALIGILAELRNLPGR